MRSNCVNRALFVLALGCFGGLQIGCNSAPPKAVVAGKVLCAGAAIKGGQVSFIMPDGQPYVSDIQADGSYRVDGVPVGDAIIIVIPPNDEQARLQAMKERKALPAAPPPPFPAKYSDMTTSDLKYTVKPGENQHDVEMKKS